MKKNIVVILLACLFFSLFNACQGDEEHGNADQCIIAIQFDVLQRPFPCTGYRAFFDLLFIDQNGVHYEFPFELPSDSEETQFISLPSGNTYDGWVIDNGGYGVTCGKTLFFEITVLNPETGEQCMDWTTTLDGRKETLDEFNPDLNFTLPEKCDGCPDFVVPVDECIEEDCGGFYEGNYSGFGYYTYPLQELYLCPNRCVRVTGLAFGVPNRFTLRADGAIIDSQWVGDGSTYTQGPWSGTNIPLNYNYILETQPEVEYTLQVETVAPQGMTDSWSCSLNCDSCD